MTTITTEKKKSLTKVQAWNELIELVQASDMDESKAGEILAILHKEIDALARKNERAKEKAQEKREPLRAAVEGIIAQMDEDVNYTLDDLCGFSGIEGMTPMKLRPLLNPYVTDGTIVQYKNKGKVTFCKSSGVEVEEA